MNSHRSASSTLMIQRSHCVIWAHRKVRICVCGESAPDKEKKHFPPVGRERDHWAGGNQNNLTLGFIYREVRIRAGAFRNRLSQLSKTLHQL